MVGDGAQWGKDCRALEKYLDQVASQPSGFVLCHRCYPGVYRRFVILSWELTLIWLTFWKRRRLQQDLENLKKVGWLGSKTGKSFSSVLKINRDYIP